MTASIFLPDLPGNFYDTYTEIRCPDINLRFLARNYRVQTIAGDVALPRPQ